jgi:hypothetical protein
MTWTKLSDDYSDEAWPLTDAEFRLLTEFLVWSNRKLLDCRIPKEDVPRFAKRPEALPGLLAKGYIGEDGDCYVIHFHARYQRASEDVIKQQKVNAENGAKGGRPPKPGRERFTPKTDSVSDSVSEHVADDGRTPVDACRMSQLETDSLSDSKTEMDRTGQDSVREATTTKQFPSGTGDEQFLDDDLSDDEWQRLVSEAREKLNP